MEPSLPTILDMTHRPVQTQLYLPLGESCHRTYRHVRGDNLVTQPGRGGFVILGCMLTYKDIIKLFQFKCVCLSVNVDFSQKKLKLHLRSGVCKLL